MVAGYTIRVLTPRPGEDDMVEIFHVAEPNATEAKAILSRAKSLVNEAIELVGPLSEAEVEGLGLSKGDIASAV